MARAPAEHDIQRAWCLWYGGEQRQDGTWKIKPAQLPGVVWWHTPNSGEGRDAFQGVRLKQAGVRAGIPDIILLWGGAFGLEFKKPNGRPAETQRSSAQVRTQAALLAAGMVACTTVDSLEDAKAFVRRHGLTLC